jgi:hypothetical protein
MTDSPAAKAAEGLAVLDGGPGVGAWRVAVPAAVAAGWAAAAVGGGRVRLG